MSHCGHQSMLAHPIFCLAATSGMGVAIVVVLLKERGGGLKKQNRGVVG
ncbi:MAG: hypothetical protein ACJA0N_001765 [Pseudohongiellaceae bacterium]|jgi:hypothetical protein